MRWIFFGFFDIFGIFWFLILKIRKNSTYFFKFLFFEIFDFFQNIIDPKKHNIAIWKNYTLPFFLYCSKNAFPGVLGPRLQFWNFDIPDNFRFFDLESGNSGFFWIFSINEIFENIRGSNARTLTAVGVDSDELATHGTIIINVLIWFSKNY